MGRLICTLVCSRNVIKNHCCIMQFTPADWRDVMVFETLKFYFPVNRLTFERKIILLVFLILIYLFFPDTLYVYVSCYDIFIIQNLKMSFGNIAAVLILYLYEKNKLKWIPSYICLWVRRNSMPLTLGTYKYIHNMYILYVGIYNNLVTGPLVIAARPFL